MPLVHFVGKINGAMGFSEGSSIFARWNIRSSYNDNIKNWKVTDGDVKGRTWIAERTNCDHIAIWNEPIDVTYSANNCAGWPQICIEIVKVDFHKRTDIIGYGCAYLPSQPGEHNITINCFRPKGSSFEEWQAYFLGGYPMYENPKILQSGDSRFGHMTVSTGEVHMNIFVVLKDFHEAISTGPVDPAYYINKTVSEGADAKKNASKLAILKQNLKTEQYVDQMLQNAISN